MAVIKLHRNYIYNTYQLYARMASKTAPKDGLKLGALCVIRWLKEKLEENCPEELRAYPDPSEYRTFPEEKLESFRYNRGFLIDIISAPQQGKWCLQLTEPDMGSSDFKGNPGRAPVPGRTFESDIGFKVTADGHLDCAFKTVASDPDKNIEPAEVFRFKFVAELAKDPDFGLKQIVELNGKKIVIGSRDQVKTFREMTENLTNQLPLIVFVKQPEQAVAAAKLQGTPKKEASKKEPLFAPAKKTIDMGARFTAALPGSEFPPVGGSAFRNLERELGAPAKTEEKEDVCGVKADDLASLVVGVALVYELGNEQLDRFNETFGENYVPGDVILFEPACFGGQRSVIDIKGKDRREQVAYIGKKAFTYSRGKTFTFGEVSFLDAVRDRIFRSIEEAEAAVELTKEELQEKLEEVRKQYELAGKEQEEEKERLKDQIRRQKAYADQLEEEKKQLRKQQEKEIAAKDAELSRKEELIEFLRRKCDRPDDAAGIPEWVEKHFEGRLLLHERAEDLLRGKEARECDEELLCDALEYLASEVYDMRYLGLPEDDANVRCSEKYGRTFEITPVNEVTYNDRTCFSEYHVLYDGKQAVLDMHLRCGNATPFLVRIYYFYDDEKKCIVIGSLPAHLKTITFG